MMFPETTGDVVVAMYVAEGDTGKDQCNRDFFFPIHIDAAAEFQSPWDQIKSCLGTSQTP